MSLGRGVAVVGASAALIAGGAACSDGGEKGGVPMTSTISGEEICAKAFEGAQQQPGFEVFTQPLDMRLQHEYNGRPAQGVGVIALRDCHMVNPADGVALRLAPFLRAVERPDGQVGVDFALSDEPVIEGTTDYSLEDTDLSGISPNYNNLGDLPAGLLMLACKEGEIPMVSLEGASESLDPAPAIGDMDSVTVNLVEGAQFGCANAADIAYYTPEA